jgi:putative spermidine/putrescine transport system ATP-binding protein
MVRPERLQILSGSVPDHVNVLHGTVRNVVYQGDSFLLQVALAEGTLINVRGVSTSRAMAAIPRPDERVMLGLAREDAILLADASQVS